jgi:hypothetical protein
LPESIAHALDEVDRAFGPRTGRTAPVDGCRGHCFTDAELDELSGPVAEISEWTLFHAVSSWGNTLDGSVEWLRWVTPRLLRAMFTADTQLVDDEMLAVRLAAAGWRDWPGAERQAMEALCTAFWRAVLTGPADEWSASAALCFLVPLTGEIASWLRIWSGTPGRSADVQVAELWQQWDQDILSGELDVAVYQKGPNIAPELADWLLDHGMRRLAEGDLDELKAWSLAQLPLPPEERWR